MEDGTGTLHVLGPHVARPVPALGATGLALLLQDEPRGGGSRPTSEDAFPSGKKPPGGRPPVVTSLALGLSGAVGAADRRASASVASHILLASWLFLTRGELSPSCLRVRVPTHFWGVIFKTFNPTAVKFGKE